MSLKHYLQEHFVDKPGFASLAEISQERLEELIAAKAIPGATYACDGNSIRSAVFGRIDIDEDLTGEYFRPECKRWAIIGAQAPAGSERTSVLEVLTQELRAALARHLPDRATVEEKIREFFPSYLDGTFGLCVSDPSTGWGIVRKELLQARLAALTANGSNPHPAGIQAQELIQLIDDYADASMPFSPAEYALSSRKRLVDDLRAVVTRS